MSYLTLASTLIAITGFAFAFTGIRRLTQRKFMRAASLELTGIVFLLLSSSTFLLASNLHTYQRLTYEEAIAEVSFEQINDQQFQARIDALDSDFHKVVELNGDEWQLDSQVLTWQGVATLFGLDANYRLHRISGRYLDIEEEQQKPRSVYSLVEKPAVIEDERFDLWKFAHRYQDWLRWVDAGYGSAVYLPMTDGARFQVSISRTGMVARPANKQAQQAVNKWIGS
jgi:hypothetical protein